VIYLDTSALAKLVIREAETAELGEWLPARVCRFTRPARDLVDDRSA
jgi:predicted nucleic acid-binding protein